MKISDNLLCFFSASVEDRDDSYIIEVPAQEVDVGDLDENDVYRVAVLGADSPEDTDRRQDSGQSRPTPPVEEGDERTVDIEDIGDQGDGIARVERGYVLIIPDTDKGERVTVKVTDIRESMAFAEVVEREEYYE